MVAMRWPFVAATVFVAVAWVVGSTSPVVAYTVRQGDTLWKISRQTGMSVPDLVRLNGLGNPDVIRPGQELRTSGGQQSQPAPATGPPTYRVRAGDTLWSISRRTGVSVNTLMAVNHIGDPSRLHAGQTLLLQAPPPPAAKPAGPSVSQPAARALLRDAARKHGLRPSFVLAVSYWESGWNQDVVSATGAVGLMQLEPGTAAYAGPQLLGRKIDIHNPRDNADLGAALLRAYVDEFNDPKLALAAYFQGEAAAHQYGIYPSSQSYVNGIWDLRNRFEANAP